MTSRRTRKTMCPRTAQALSSLTGAPHPLSSTLTHSNTHKRFSSMHRPTKWRRRRGRRRRQCSTESTNDCTTTRPALPLLSSQRGLSEAVASRILEINYEIMFRYLISSLLEILTDSGSTLPLSSRAMAGGVGGSSRKVNTVWHPSDASPL
jgi:hypothetical protein